MADQSASELFGYPRSIGINCRSLRMIMSAFTRITISLIVLVAVANPTAIAQRGSSDRAPALEVFSPNGSRSVIVGTFHVDVPEAHQIAPDELHTFGRLIVENADPVAASDVGAADTKVEAARLTAAEQDALVQRMACLRYEGEPLLIDVAQASLSVLSALAWLPCGADLAFNKDQQLVSEARRLGLEVSSLDTDEMRSRLLGRLQPKFYLSQIRTALKTDPNAFYEPFFQALNAGDFDAVLEMAMESTEHEYATAMIEERNVAWLDLLVDELSKGNALVAVGAAHLGGNAGLIELLSAKGFRISPITVPAATQGRDPK